MTCGFSLARGEIHGLVGENGAGKSTLMKIIAGVHAEYQGEMRLDGRPVRYASPRDARAAGIGMVHQELSAVRELSVAENVHLGMQPVNRLGLIDWRAMRRDAAEHLQSLGIDVDPRTRMGALPLGLQQLVELARVLFSGARIIILDEPTSALSPPEVQRLFALLRRLREAGRSIVFISHFLDDVLAICERLTVFRNGRTVATEPCAAVDKRWVIDRMIGAGHEGLEESYLSDIPLHSRPDAKVVLELDGLSRAGAYQDVSLRVHEGEVLGIYGFLGSGQLELARTLFGRLPAERGRIALDGRTMRLSSTARARRAGAGVPAGKSPDDAVRRRAGVQEHDDRHSRSHPPALAPAARRACRSPSDTWAGSASARPSVDHLLSQLSGGNQQKVALAKWLTHLPRVLVLSEPTRGMDVGAKDDVVTIVRELREQGIGIVVVSTEPETVLSLADRILVMKKGSVVREFADEPVSKDRLLEAA